MKVNLYLYGFLTLVAITIWSAIFTVPNDSLKIIACDVGQGDAILVTYKNIQILTDGGPNKKVLECLDKYIPFYDRTLELVILTHPDSDHSTGLIDVIKRYNVVTLLANPIDPGTETYQALKNVVGSKGIEVINSMEGMRLGMDMIYLDMFNPSKEMIDNLKEEIGNNKISTYKPILPTNSYSIVYKLSFKDFTGIFTGDIGIDISDRLAKENRIGKVNYIKIPHHGSRNGLTENLLKTLDPETAVISVGKNNRYGHPTKEVIDMLNGYGIQILRTDEIGDVVTVIEN